MIQWMQKHKKYLVITIWISTIAFVGAGFVGWGAYSFAVGERFVAKVGDNTISRSDLEREYARLFAIYNQLTGGKLGQKEAEGLGLRNQALNNLIYTQLMLNYAHDLGLLVSDEKVAAEIAKETQFYEKGVFSQKLYREILAQNNLLPKDYENAIRKSLLLKELDNVLQIAPTRLEKESVAAALYMKDRLSIEILEPKKEPITLDEAEIRQYWEQNKQSYKGAVRYSFVFDTFAPTDIAASDSELQEYYEKFITNYQNVKTFAEAKAQIREDYQKSEAEKQALRRYIEYKKQAESYTGEHVTLDSEQIAEKFGQELLGSLLALKPTEALKPILTESGFVTLKLQNIEQSKALDFESAKEQVVTDLLRQKYENLLRQNADSRIENFVGSDIGFVARDDIGKLSMLGAEDAAAFLEQLFAKTKAKDYMILAQKAILYRISAQELFAFENLANNKDFLENNVVQLKDRIIESAFMNYLQKRYIVIRADAELGNR